MEIVKREMKQYYIMISYKDEPVAGCVKRGRTADEAIDNAYFALICKYPNVRFDRMDAMEYIEGIERR